MILSPVDPEKIADISGQRFGRLLVVEPAGAARYRTGMAVYFRCRCDCGAEILAQRSNLRRATRSCGCDRETISRRGSTPLTHPLYKTWAWMIERCHSPASPSYKDYGARGLTVCDRWRKGDDAAGGLDYFLADMGPRPSKNHSIERRDNGVGYTPSNCFWATRTAQGRNKRNNVLISHNGQTMPVSAWSEQTGIPYFTLMRRVRLGWTAERAVTEPIRGRT